jgi:hypothetical protein
MQQQHSVALCMSRLLKMQHATNQLVVVDVWA